MTPALLAHNFANLIRRLTTQEEFDTIRKRNKTIPPGCCATHDFMDANMVMADAFSALAGREMDLESDADTAMWNAAWEIAKAEYLTEKI